MMLSKGIEAIKGKNRKFELSFDPFEIKLLKLH